MTIPNFRQKKEDEKQVQKTPGYISRTHLYFVYFCIYDELVVV